MIILQLVFYSDALLIENDMIFKSVNTCHNV